MTQKIRVPIVLLGVLLSAGQAFGGDRTWSVWGDFASPGRPPDPGMRRASPDLPFITAVAPDGLGENAKLILIFIVMMGAAAGRKAQGEHHFFRSHQPIHNSPKKKRRENKDDVDPW